MRIDSHQHFWQYNPLRHEWIDGSMQILKRDFMPNDLHPLLKQSGFDGCVAVQAEQSEQETQFLLKLAEEYEFIKGVVGWIDLHAPNLEQRLKYFSRYPKLKGFRHVVQAEPDGFMTGEQFVNGVRKLQAYNFTYDILIYEHQLKECIVFVKQLPEIQFVIDHLAKPNIKEKSFDEWETGMKRLASFPNVNVKLSGMVTEADWKNWKKPDLIPYLATCLNNFGTDRVMIGSDWPVCLLAGDYNKVVEVVDEFISGLSQTEYDAIMGQTAARFYRLR